VKKAEPLDILYRSFQTRGPVGASRRFAIAKSRQHGGSRQSFGRAAGDEARVANSHQEIFFQT
jgi:hypothetical protein